MNAAILLATEGELGSLAAAIGHPVEVSTLTPPPQDRLSAALAGSPAFPVEPRYFVRILDSVDAGELGRMLRLQQVVAGWICDERGILAPSTDLPGALSRLAFARRRSDIDHPQFVAHYLGTHVPLVMQAGPLFRRYVVRLVDDPQWDAIVQQEFVDRDTWNEHDRLIFEQKPAIREDLGNFLGGIVQYSAQVVGRLPQGGDPQLMA